MRCSIGFACVLAVLWVFAAPRTASANPRPAELRLQFFAPSLGWSQARRFGSTSGDNRAYNGVYLSPGLGARFFPKLGSHGVLADMEYKFLARADERWCLFGASECRSARTEFGVAHVGYAYRHIVDGPRRPDKRFWGFTPHVSFSAGWADNEPTELPTPSRSPVVGLRAGIDMDLHFNVWFIGWSLSYEALKQTRSPFVDEFAWWHFFGWNLIPLVHLGVDLGKPDAHR